MLLSDSHRFIFIHVNKAAGTSMIRALAPHGLAPAQSRWNKTASKLGLVRDYRRRFYPVHTYASQLRRELPASVWGAYFKFAFVRNPWDWLVSTYHYLCSTPHHRYHRLVKAMPGFADYAAFEIERDKRSQAAFVCDDEDVIVDYVGRFETLAEDFAVVCERIGIDASLPHENRTRHRDYREFYDDDLIRRVGEHWRRDVELFGYEFDRLAADARRDFSAAP